MNKVIQITFTTFFSVCVSVQTSASVDVDSDVKNDLRVRNCVNALALPQYVPDKECVGFPNMYDDYCECQELVTKTFKITTNGFCLISVPKLDANASQGYIVVKEARYLPIPYEDGANFNSYTWCNSQLAQYTVNGLPIPKLIAIEKP